MNTRLMIRCDEEVANLFRELSDIEGRKHGKLLQILIEEYKRANGLKKEEQ